jgi:hypothetical protein
MLDVPTLKLISTLVVYLKQFSPGDPNVGLVYLRYILPQEEPPFKENNNVVGFSFISIFLYR